LQDNWNLETSESVSLNQDLTDVLIINGDILQSNSPYVELF